VAISDHVDALRRRDHLDICQVLELPVEDCLLDVSRH
jgi:hypothetical protein